LIRIGLNADPDPIPIPIQGFDDQKFKNFRAKNIFFFYEKMQSFITKPSRRT
jgi:hypothetical protein